MSTSHSQIGNKPNKEKNPEFTVNTKLDEFTKTTITSPNKRKEQDFNTKVTNQDISDNNKKTSDTIINKLKNSNSPDAAYNYKKDFLVLAFNQTEDQNSLEYKRKILSRKLMTDISFSLNKAFEFSFEDKIKNNIIMTLSKHNKTYYDYDEKKEVNDYKTIDNQFILNFCNGDIDMNNFFIPINENELKNENKDVYLGNKNTKEELENSVMEDEIAHAKKNYAPQKGPHLVLNYVEDEEFDEATYKFFVDFIDTYKDEPLASKIKLVLSYITEVNPNTKREIYTNKEKNEILKLWKSEYDNAFQIYNEKIKSELEKKKKENKNKKKLLMARESVGPAVNNLIKKKPAQKSNNVSGTNNNTNNDLRATGNFNFDNNINYNKQRFSISKGDKK